MKTRIIALMLFIIGGVAFSQISFFNQDSDSGTDYSNVLEIDCKNAGRGCINE